MICRVQIIVLTTQCGYKALNELVYIKYIMPGTQCTLYVGAISNGKMTAALLADVFIIGQVLDPEC
jgi:hypothetical protein